MFQHLHSCEAFKFLFPPNNLPGCFNNKADVANFNSHVHQAILNNATVTKTNYVFWDLYHLRGTYLNLTMALKLPKSFLLF